MMKSLDEFLPDLRLYAPGLADPTAYLFLRKAAIDFCERSRVWRFEDEFPIIGDHGDPIFSPAGSVIHEIEGVWFNAKKLRPVTPEKMDQLVPYWRAGSAVITIPNGTPQYVTQTAPNNIVMVPYGAGTVKVSLYLKPSNDAMEVPDFLVDQYRETIAHGALARILLIPNQSFTSPDMAAAFGNSFRGKVDGGSTLGAKGQQRAPIRSKGHYF